MTPKPPAPGNVERAATEIIFALGTWTDRVKPREICEALRAASLLAPTPSEDAIVEAQEFLDSYGLSNIPRTSWDDDLTKAFSAMLASAEARGIERAAKVVPTNWLDEILTGENSIGPAPYTNRQVEDLLRRVQDRIRALVRP